MSTNLRDAKKPKYLSVADKIAKDIETGVLKPGDRLPSFGEMGRLFGVASNTVDKIFVALEQDGLIRREVGRGTFVTERSAQRSGLLALTGVAFAKWRFHPYMVHLAEGIQSVTDREGMQLVLLNSDSDKGWDKVEGVLVCGQDAQDCLSRMPLRLPSVALLASVKDVASVVPDDYQGGLDATRYLLSLGHRRIAYLVNTKYNSLLHRRLSGYHVALREAGVQGETEWVYEPVDPDNLNDNRRSGYLGMKQWLENGWRELGCTALMAQNDEVAIGVVEALYEAGIRVPEDISVMGFDGTEISNGPFLNLTTVEVPLAQIGVIGVELLLKQIRGERSPAMTATIPTTLREGNSTAPLATK